jgi:Ger(x)C family germination protein
VNKRIAVVLAVMSLVLSGCWDLDYLKDARLIYGVGFDVTPEGKLIESVVIREATGTGTQVQPMDEFYSATGDTTRQLRDIIDRQISGGFRAYKNQIVLLGEELAHKDIYPVLDVLYRDPKSALNARIAVSEGMASDVLAMTKVGTTLIAEHLVKMLEDKADKTLIPKTIVRTISPLMLDPGKDFTLPYLQKTDSSVPLAGQALFHGHRMTGKLGPDESTLLQLLRGELGRVARITRKVSDSKKTDIEHYITIDVQDLKRKMKVETDPAGNIRVKLEAKLLCTAVEYPEDHLDEDQVVQGLNKKLSHDLTKQAKKLIAKLQEAKCDVFGIGRELIAYHPEVWRKKNWEEDYQKVRFEPKVDVEIMSHGILN